MLDLKKQTQTIMSTNKRGRLITIMGINNIGKTTQQKLLPMSFEKRGLSYVLLKYPLYDLEPTGPQCNDYLRNRNPEKLSPKDFQELCAQNRRDYQPQLQHLLENNDFIIAEMYTGSGICFGMADGVSKEELFAMNADLMEPDISILLDGERFFEAREKGHNYESNDEKMEIIRKNHLELAQDLNWVIVNANQPVEKVHAEILKIIFA